MADYDLNVDVAKAQDWRTRVSTEVELTNITLEDVAKELQTVPDDEDDIIMTGLKSYGETMQEKWGQLIEGFNSIGDLFENFINERLNFINTQTTKIDNMDTNL